MEFQTSRPGLVVLRKPGASTDRGLLYSGVPRGPRLVGPGARDSGWKLGDRRDWSTEGWEGCVAIEDVVEEEEEADGWGGEVVQVIWLEIEVSVVRYCGLVEGGKRGVDKWVELTNDGHLLSRHLVLGVRVDATVDVSCQMHPEVLRQPSDQVNA